MLPVTFLPALALQQAQGAWVGPTMALSLVVIAIAFVVIAAILAAGARKAASARDALTHELASLRREAEPTLKDLQEMAKSGREVAVRLREEMHEVIRTSQRLRFDVERGFRRARRRLSDLDALAEVVQGEVEDTALDVASTLRTMRRSKGMIGRLRRLVRGRG